MEAPGRQPQSLRPCGQDPDGPRHRVPVHLLLSRTLPYNHKNPPRDSLLHALHTPNLRACGGFLALHYPPRPLTRARERESLRGRGRATAVAAACARLRLSDATTMLVQVREGGMYIATTDRRRRLN